MRVMSDMTWTQERMPGINLWPVYEAKLNSLHTGISIRIICQYDRKTFPPEALMAVLKTHPKVVAHGQVSKSNYYMSTEQLLAEDYGEKELDRMLDIVRTSNQVEAELQDRTEMAEARGQRIRELEEELAQLKTHSIELEKDLNDLSARFNAQSLELNSSKESLAGLDEAMARKNEELISKIQQMERLEADLNKVRSELAAETADLAESVALGEKIKSDLAARSEEAEQAWAARDHLHREKEQLIKIVQERDEGLVELHAEVERLYGVVRGRKEEVDALRTQLTAVENNLSKLKAQAEQYRLDLLVQEAVTQGLRDVMERTASDMEVHSGKATSLEEELTAVKRELHAERMARDTLAFELSQAHTALAEKEAELNNDRQALTESNEGYQAIFEQAGAGIVRSDLEGRLLEANDRFHTMLGYHPAELRGKSYRDIVHRDDVGKTTAMYERLLAGEIASTSMLTKYIRRLGTTTWANVVMFPVKDAKGKPRYFMSIVEDRTDQMMAEMALAELDPAEAAKRQAEIDSRSKVLAKDLSDSLTVIMGSVSLAKEYVIPEGRMYGKLKQIESASETARDLASLIMAPAKVKTDSASNPPSASLVKGKGRILLMDDDERILESTGDLLRYLGYNVETAREGAEALNMCREASKNNKPFDLAILDLEIRSGMGGEEAGNTLAQENPSLKLVASMGLVADPEKSDSVVKGFAATIAKPYSADVLSKVVADVMTQSK
jgi:PAS domain S-box-containing protein